MKVKCDNSAPAVKLSHVLDYHLLTYSIWAYSKLVTTNLNECAQDICIYTYKAIIPSNVAHLVFPATERYPVGQEHCSFTQTAPPPQWKSSRHPLSHIRTTFFAQTHKDSQYNEMREIEIFSINNPKL